MLIPAWMMSCRDSNRSSSIISLWVRNWTLHCLQTIKFFFFLGNYHTSHPLAGRNNFKMGKIPLCQHSAQERTFNSCPCNSSLCPLHEEKLGTLQTDAWAQAIASALQKAAGVSGIVRYQHSQLHGSGGNAVTEILNENGKKLYFQHNIKAI